MVHVRAGFSSAVMIACCRLLEQRKFRRSLRRRRWKAGTLFGAGEGASGHEYLFSHLVDEGLMGPDHCAEDELNSSDGTERR